MLIIFLKLSLCEQPVIEGPSFQTNLNIEDQNIEDILQYFHRSTILSSNPKENQLRKAEYFHCTIAMQNCDFIKNYAFGSTLSSASGGALYASNSEVSADGKQDTTTHKFESNSASAGGAIAGVASKVLIQSFDFITNYAQKLGGALYFQGILENGKTNQDHFLLVKKCKFTTNEAQDVGGAIYITSNSESQISDSYFQENKATISGGALYSCDTQVVITSSTFKSNTVDVLSRNKETQNEKLKREVDYSRFTSCGGAAIFFCGAQLKVNLETTGCCFLKNKVKHGYIFGSGNPGDNVLLDSVDDDMVQYYSNGDRMNIHMIARNKERSIYYRYKKAEGDVLECTEQLVKDDTQTGDVKSYTKAPRTGPGAREVKEGDEPTRIPRPTTFTYKATAITKLNLEISSKVSSWVEENSPGTIIGPDVKPNEPNLPPTLVNPPSDKPIAEKIPPPSYDPKKPTTLTFTRWRTNTDIYTWITTKTHIMTYNEENVPTFVHVNTEGNFKVNTIVTVSDEIIINVDEGDPKPKKNLGLILGLVFGFFAIIIIALLIVYFVYFKRDKEETSSMVEMPDETAKITTDNTTTVTNDNPLYTKTDVGEDDPFKQDFEEITGMEQNEGEKSDEEVIDDEV